jgi:hypothetical protein
VGNETKIVDWRPGLFFSRCSTLARMGLAGGGTGQVSRPTPWWLRVFLLVNVVQDFGLGLSALFVPAHILIPLKGLSPLNARFVGSLYLGGGIVILCAVLVRRPVDARIALYSLFVITVLVLGMTFAYWARFTAAGVPKLWMLTYVVDPILVPIAIVTLGIGGPATPGRHRLTALFLAEAVILGGPGIALLLAPAGLLTAWPWTLTRLLARVYGAFFVAFAVGALLAAYERRPAAVQPLLTGSVALLGFMLGASLLHLDRFQHDPARWLWFGGLAVGLVVLCSGQATLLRARHRDSPAEVAP